MSAVCVLPLAVLIALLSTGVMSRGMLSLLGSVAWAQLGVWTDGGSFLYPTNNEDVIVGASSEANADHLLKVSGSAVFNEQGADADSRIEGDTDANLIYTDASADRVGVGTSSPSAKLDVRQSGGAVVTTNCVLAVQKNAEDSDSCDLNILGGDEGTTRVCFGDTTDPTIGEWIADASTDECRFVAEVLKLDCGQKVKRTGGITSAYTIAGTDYYVSCSNPGAAYAVTLPSASSAGAGKTYVVKNLHSSTGSINLTRAGSDTIDGATTKPLAAGEAVTVISDGSSNWEIIANPA